MKQLWQDNNYNIDKNVFSELNIDFKLWVREVINVSWWNLNSFKSVFKNIKCPWKTWFEFFNFLPGVEYDHGSEPNKKTENGKVNFILEKEEEKNRNY